LKSLRVIHALGIPAKVAPKTAGNIIATAIIEELSQIELPPPNILTNV